ncbi:MAG TPA: type IV pilin, partial [Methanoregula sp.]|nr:type IV pilin [Methanoregula sp.]
MKETDRKESAVSPVVGVMLMLAITVMIAAIVSAAAGGLAATEKKAPNAIIEVSIFAAKEYGGCTIPSMTVKHISGNALQTKDLQIITYYRAPSGQTVKGSLSGQTGVAGDDDWAGFTSSEHTGVLFLNDVDRFDEITKISDTIQDTDKGFANWFGNASATFHPGDILVTPAQFCEATDPHNPGMEFFFPGIDLEKDFRTGSVVAV